MTRAVVILDSPRNRQRAHVWIDKAPHATRVEMKAAETIVHLRRELPRRVRSMVPAHVWALMKPYGLERRDDER